MMTQFAPPIYSTTASADDELMLAYRFALHCSKYLVRVSYLQIYNEVISDLLKPEKTNLVIRSVSTLLSTTPRVLLLKTSFMF